MGDAPIHVLKFGSSVLPDESTLPDAVHEVYRRLREGSRVIAVVSALGSTTDTLLTEAATYGDEPGNSPASQAVAALVATGESRAVALLTLALGRAGIPARALDAAAIGLTTEGPLLDSRTTGLDASVIRRSLDGAPVLVVPGFLGRAQDGSTSLLGRGGSDLTALFIASRLGARCTLVKDVDGLYDRDPAGNDGIFARRYEHVSYEDVLALSEGIVQHKAVRYARDCAVEFEVSCCGGVRGTVVGQGRSCFGATGGARRPLRVALLGLGTVGRGVYDELSRQRDRFVITGVLVRDIEKHILDGVPERLLTQEATSLPGAADGPPDLVVEALGGTDPAEYLVRLALSRGIHVVTANKQLIAEYGDSLEAIAKEAGARLLYSAAVGGAVPMLELVQRLCPDGIRRIEGVINGTSNFVLNRLWEGLPLASVIAEAQSLGFAESDPSDDLDGIDAARKLVLLCRVAWGTSVNPSAVDIAGIRDLRIGSDGQRVRLIARAERAGSSLRLTVGPEHVRAGHPLADLPGAENSLVVETESGRTEVVRGIAAGRVPTAESVIADVLQIRRECLRDAAGDYSASGAGKEALR